MAMSRLNLSVENESTLLLTAKALSSDIRINILKTLKNSSMSISELAETLGQPVSSTALNVKILENANLVSTEIIYTKLGKTRLCRRTYDNLEISVWINDVEIGTWTCPGDFGGRRGQLNPSYWPLNNTQYGIWNNWRVDRNGTTLNGKSLSEVTINALKIEEKPYISLKIGVKPDAKNMGGMNLFGEKMGDYPQDIIVKLLS